MDRAHLGDELAGAGKFLDASDIAEGHHIMLAADGVPPCLETSKA
jgi:hypothetical protein